MTRAYLRLDPGYDERKASYPDGPYATLIACLCLAEFQPERGRFRSVRYLKALLERRARFLPFLFAHDDLLLLGDGRVYIDGWDEWQEGDWKVAERIGRVRNRPRNKANGAVTATTVTDVTVKTVHPQRDALSDSGAKRSGAKRSGAIEGVLPLRGVTSVRDSSGSGRPS